MNMLKLTLLLMLGIFAVFLSACDNIETGMKNGYYCAEASDFDSYGWKEYISIYVRDNKIVTVEYNARNSSGFIKSWDMDYMRTMNEECGTYPNDYTRTYSVALLNWQNPDHVDAVTGATHSHKSFKLLAKAVIKQAEADDKQVILVDIPENAENE